MAEKVPDVSVAPRIAPISPDEQSEKVEQFFHSVDGPRGPSLSKLNIVRTLARYPDLAMAYNTFGNHVLRASSLPERLQVLVTLRTAWLYNCDYEWNAHARYAGRRGVSVEEVEATKVGPEAPGWATFDRIVLRSVEQLRYETTIDDATWQALEQHLDQEQLLDLLFTVGNYAMLAMVLNTIRVAPET
jgi:4-carboxymuconolactone decarboxylase